MKPIVEIRNWTICFYYGKPRLFGDVIEHPRLGEQEGVITTPIVKIHKDINKVETVNTVYKLRGPGKCLLENAGAI
jgi:hypothetical protein